MSAKKRSSLFKWFRGGSGAAEHGINVFGGIGQQHAVGPNDNTIAMKQMSGGKRKGGSMVVDVGAPLVLTGLNQYMKRRSAKKGGKKVGGKCSLKGGKKAKMGGKSKKMMKKSKWGGKRKTAKKRGGKKMMGGDCDEDEKDENGKCPEEQEELVSEDGKVEEVPEEKVVSEDGKVEEDVSEDEKVKDQEEEVLEDKDKVLKEEEGEN